MYPRSFIFSNQPFEGGSPASIGYLASGPATNLTSFSKRFPDGSTISVLCIGYLINLEDVTADDNQVVAALADVFPIESLFHEMLSVINGRFALIIRYNDDWRVYNDATGMRTIYYTAGLNFMLSSHASLIAGINGATPNVGYFEYYQFGYPGLMSQYDGIPILPPNLHLAPTTGKLTRFWPADDRVERTLEDAYAIFAQYFMKARDGILRRHSPVVSLTSGLDSRATFSATKAFDNVEYFSYNQTHLLSYSDISVAKRICSIYEKPHRTINIANINKDSDRIYIPEYRHIPYLTEAYFGNFGVQKAMHIRSNVADISKNIHNRGIERGTIRIGHPSDFIRRNTKLVGMSKPAKKYADAQFYDMFGKMGYDPFSRSLVSGYKPIDLFFWEHDSTTWHGPVLLGSDITFDTYALYNSRVLLEAMLSVSNAERKTRSIQSLFVERNAPEIGGLPINPPVPMGVRRILHGIHWRIKSIANR